MTVTVTQYFLAGGGNTEKKTKVTLGNDASVRDALDHLGLLAKEHIVVMVNGRRQDPGYLLKEGDEIGIFPVLGGG